LGNQVLIEYLETAKMEQKSGIITFNYPENIFENYADRNASTAERSLQIFVKIRGNMVNIFIRELTVWITPEDMWKGMLWLVVQCVIE